MGHKYCGLTTVRRLHTTPNMFGFLFAYPASLWLILYFVARRDADRSYSTLFYVTLGVVLVAYATAIYFPPFVLIVTPIVCVLVLRRFCYMGWLRAIIATILFVAWMCIWPTIFQKITH